MIVVVFIDVIDLAYSMLKTFATEYETVYGCQVLTSHEESNEYKFPFALRFCPVSWICFCNMNNSTF